MLCETEIHEAVAASEPICTKPHDTDLVGQDISDTHIGPADRNSSDDGHPASETHSSCAIVGNLMVEGRRYDDLRRARQRLTLQAMATCRNFCGGDKVEGAKLYAKPTLGVMLWLEPYMAAIAPLDEAIKAQEKAISKLARQLPVWGWGKGVGGLSDRFLGLIVAECAAPVGDYKSVSAVWKRMGMAVIGGGRQRRVTGDAAIEHGYVARRRSLMWNIGESIIKAQVRKDPDDETKRIAIGDLGRAYLDRKAYEAERCETAMHAHNRAKRYMEKRLLRELWKSWRATVGANPITAMPARITSE